MPEIPVLLQMTSETAGRLHGTGVLLVPSFLGHPLAAHDTAGTVFRSPRRRTQPRPFAAKSHIDLVRGPDAPVRKKAAFRPTGVPHIAPCRPPAVTIGAVLTVAVGGRGRRRGCGGQIGYGCGGGGKPRSHGASVLSDGRGGAICVQKSSRGVQEGRLEPSPRCTTYMKKKRTSLRQQSVGASRFLVCRCPSLGASPRDPSETHHLGPTPASMCLSTGIPFSCCTSARAPCHQWFNTIAHRPRPWPP